MNLFLLLWLLAAPKREVAITIDDLPIGQRGPRDCDFGRASSITDRILKPVREEHVPVTAFVVGTNCATLAVEQRRELLKKWQDAGAELGNHTWSHPDYDSLSIADFQENILKGDASLRETMGMERVRWFRSPMLHTGKDAARESALAEFLAQHNWREATVTVSASDWMFASVLANTGDPQIADRVRKEYIPFLDKCISALEDRPYPLVLLMHANELNAQQMPEVIATFKRHGFRFVSLEQALSDPAYKTIGKFQDPEEPKWLQQEFNKPKPR